MCDNKKLLLIFVFITFMISQNVLISQEALSNESTSNLSQGNDNEFKFGAIKKVKYNLENSGNWEVTTAGDRIWNLKLSYAGTTSLNVMFDHFFIPKGGKLVVSTSNIKEAFVYTFEKNPVSKKLGTWPLDGDEISLTLYEPKSQKGKAKIEICQVIQGDKKVAFSSAKIISERTNECDIDAMCDVDNETINVLKQRLIHSVVLINIGFGVCTGTLINNTRNDGKLYLLTANHCLGDSNPAFWSFRFNFFNDANICSDPDFRTFSDFQVVNGAKILARNAKTDFALLELNETVDPQWNIEWAGWNNKNEIPEISFGLHHPAGNPTKLALDYHDLLTEEIEFRGEATRVWTLDPDFGGWDLGITTRGSSGSALFNGKGEIIGQLLGGNAQCLENFDNDRQDHYGKFTESWAISVNPEESLMKWLDPDNTGVQTLGMLSEERKFDGNSIKLFPNPIKNEILFLNQLIEGSYTIYNMQGVVLLQRDKAFFSSIDVGSLAIGHYLIEIFDTNGEKVVKTFLKTI